ncbi:hypothetical protein MSAS_16380 [Mycobacterium saskatchewanense]|uniref:Uncharacterized protein n=1 Tax=Mycobacterium saskatchewanense TaxID=220927 RepID=A0AAJ3NLQ4_9MYCO|nr:hypothetical protein AWC23_23615 [Mycobacterium saskatchewanense]BBX62464.1 hypothetical protein MSAS_16380 [Mycobacterium saskatchewanense]
MRAYLLAGPSGSAIIVVDAAGDNTVVVSPGANGWLSLDAPHARAALTECDVLLTLGDSGDDGVGGGGGKCVRPGPSWRPTHRLPAEARSRWPRRRP